eukprot:2344067-Prymnesium_polylepis.2
MSAQMPKAGALGEKSSLYLQDTLPIPRPYSPLDTMDRITVAARPSSSGISNGSGSVMPADCGSALIQ